jgi:isopenicillin N synthase-like dioxygenase
MELSEHGQRTETRVVDLRRFTQGDATSRAAFAQEVGEALRDAGLFLLANHGVPRALIERVHAQAARFFALPAEEKRKTERRELAGLRGYTSLGRERARDHTVPDLKEYFSVGRELRDATLLGYTPNMWPALPGFKEPLLELFAALDACAQALLRALAGFLGEPEERLVAMCREGDSLLRVIHYPPAGPDAPAESMPSAAHEDVNLLTLLVDESHEGLELLQRDGTWLPVQAGRGRIAVLPGDMLQLLTNGLVRSATHRVRSPTAVPRGISLPFFAHPRHEVDLSPLASCVARTGGTPRWAGIRAGELLRQRLAELGLRRQ